jgi:hypothetical protein
MVSKIRIVCIINCQVPWQIQEEFEKMAQSTVISSEQFWINSIIVALIDVAFVSFLVWRIRPSRFRELKWSLALTAAVFWSVFGIFLVAIFWDSYYRYIYPGWLRGGGKTVQNLTQLLNTEAT